MNTDYHIDTAPEGYLYRYFIQAKGTDAFLICAETRKPIGKVMDMLLDLNSTLGKFVYLRLIEYRDGYFDYMTDKYGNRYRYFNHTRGKYIDAPWNPITQSYDLIYVDKPTYIDEYIKIPLVSIIKDTGTKYTDVYLKYDKEKDLVVYQYSHNDVYDPVEVNRLISIGEETYYSIFGKNTKYGDVMYMPGWEDYFNVNEKLFEGVSEGYMTVMRLE